MCFCLSPGTEVRGQPTELVLSFHRVDPGIPIQILRLGSKCLYPLNHLAGLTSVVFIVVIIITFLTSTKEEQDCFIYRHTSSQASAWSLVPSSQHLDR